MSKLCKNEKSAPGRRCSRKSVGAFTLIEAVLALAILSLSVFVLTEATARCLAVIRVARNYQIARSVMERGEADYPIVATNPPDKIAVAPVKYENGFTFERAEPEVFDEDRKLFRVRTRVSWSESGRASFEEVVSLLYLPAAD